MTALAAEEAGAASSATAARGAGSQASAAGAGKSQAQRQRAQIDAIKAKRKPAPPPAPAPEPEPAQPKESAGDALKGGAPAEAGYVAGKASAPARALAAPLNSQAAQAGGGFLLGLMGWALALAYLRGGPAEVRKLLAAKFLNKVGP